MDIKFCFGFIFFVSGKLCNSGGRGDGWGGRALYMAPLPTVKLHSILQFNSKSMNEYGEHSLVDIFPPCACFQFELIYKLIEEDSFRIS